MPAGDRSLADFFAIYENPKTGRLHIVYDQGAKKPGDATGHLATPAVLTQVGGFSNQGTTITDPRAPLRDSSVAPEGDALANYSGLVSTPARIKEPGADLLKDAIGPELDLTTGLPVTNGGFTVTLTVKDLSAAALQKVLTDTAQASLLFTFRFVNGYQASSATAFWDPVNGFTFGYDDYTTASTLCLSDHDKCEVYPGATPIQGKVDALAGTIKMSVPRSKLRRLSGPSGDKQRPSELPAVAGSRFYDAAAFSMGNLSINQAVQNWFYPLDNTPAHDFLLPGVTTPVSAGGPSPSPGVSPSTGPGAGGGTTHNPNTSSTSILAVWTLMALVFVVTLGGLGAARLGVRRLRRKRT